MDAKPVYEGRKRSVTRGGSRNEFHEIDKGLQLRGHLMSRDIEEELRRKGLVVDKM